MWMLLIAIAVVAFIWYIKSKKQNDASSQNDPAAQNDCVIQSDVNSTNHSSEKNTKPKEDESLAPFKNKTEKQYYEMAYGLLASSDKERSGDDIRRFVEFHTSSRWSYSEYSSAERFLKRGIFNSFNLFASTTELTEALTSQGVSDDSIAQIIELNKKLDESLAYRYLPEDADRICDYKNYEYGSILDKTVICKISKESVIPLKDQPESIRNSTSAQKTPCARNNNANAKTDDKPAAQNRPSSQENANENKKSAGESVKPKENNPFAPFKNETEKQYYKMAYGLLASSPDAVDRSHIHQFIEFHVSGNVNKDLCESVIRFFDDISYFSIRPFKNNRELTKHLADKGFSSKDIETIIELNKNLETTLAYRYTQKDAEKISYGNVYKGDNSVVQLSIDPDDETLKQYYLIAYGLLDTVKPNGITFDGVKQYVEFHLNQKSNSKTLRSALTFFCEKNSQYYLIADAKSKKDWESYELLGIDPKDANKYKMSREEIFKICSRGVYKNIKSDCKEILKVVSSYGLEHFEKGWRNKDTKKYEVELGFELTKSLFRQALQDLFFEGNKTAKDVLCNRLAYHSDAARNKFYVRMGRVYTVEKALPTVAEHAAAVMLRALHFEKYGQNKEEYKTITEKDCRDFIFTSEAFKSIMEMQIADDPFNKSVKNWGNNLASKKFAIFDWIKKESGGDYLPSDSEYYYADALCNAFCKWVAEDYENGDSTDPDFIFKMLVDFFKPEEDVLEELENIDNRRDALRQQCSTCAYKNSCEERRENCPAYFPIQR